MPTNPACPQPTNLGLKKAATPDCVKNADGNFTCSYKITITNTGPAPFKDTIQLFDGLKALGTDLPATEFISATPRANWDCQPNLLCTTKSPVSLDVNKSIDLDLDFVIDKSNATADKCKVSNSALLFKPTGGAGGLGGEGKNDFGAAPENTDPGDDTGTATAKIPLAADANGVVPCDPPSLKLSKAANPQICEKAAGGFRCNYDIRVTSTGPDPFHGPLTLQDTLPAGSTLEKATGPGWTCSGAGVVQCKHDFVDVPVGQSLGVTVSVLVPEANINPNACQVTNSVALALAIGPLRGQNFNASASATIQSPLCTAPVAPPNLEPAPATCSGGMILTDAGDCVCPRSQRWNGRTCAESNTLPPERIPERRGGTNGTPACPADRPVGTPPNCCPSGTHFADGVCHRPSSGGSGTNGKNVGGTTGNKSNTPGCPSNRPNGSPPNCCPTGTHFARGVCRHDSVGTNGSRQPPVCSGDRPVGTPPNCCPTGTHFARGVCQHDSVGTNGSRQPLVCSGDRPVGTPPNCCPTGTRFDKGVCRRGGGGTGICSGRGPSAPTPTAARRERTSRAAPAAAPRQPQADEPHAKSNSDAKSDSHAKSDADACRSCSHASRPDSEANSERPAEVGDHAGLREEAFWICRRGRAARQGN